MKRLFWLVVLLLFGSVPAGAKIELVSLPDRGSVQLTIYNVPVPITKVWAFDAAVRPWDPDRVAGNVGVPVSYRAESTSEAGLGSHPLFAGKVRVFQEEAAGGNRFLGENRIAAVAPGEPAVIRIGDSRYLLVTRHKTGEKRLNVKRNDKNQVALYDQEENIRP